MMKHSDNNLAKMLTRRFRRWGDTGYSTGLASELGDRYDDFLRANVDLRNEEQVVLMAFNSENSWSVLTTRRLICAQQDCLKAMAWDEIQDVDADLSAINLASMEDSEKQVSRLIVTAVDGTKAVIDAEPGSPCIGLWNAIRLAQQLATSE